MIIQESEKTLTRKSIIKKIIGKLKNNPLKGILRPKDIPITVPDCGWNHGELKKKESGIV